MSYPKKVVLKKLLLAFSTALDTSSPMMVNHHRMVVVGSMEMARHLDLSEKEREDLFFSALIHDIGISTSFEKHSVASFDYNMPHHAIAGQKRLRRSPVLAPYAETIRHHHDRWDGNTLYGLKGEDIPFNSRIIHLIDRLTMLVRPDSFTMRDEGVFIKEVERLSGSYFQPLLVDCLNELIKEGLLLKILTTGFSPGVADKMAQIPNIEVDMEDTLGIARVFANVVDHKSLYTVGHSRNVAAVAAFVANKLKFTQEEVGAIQIAGLLHDIGKLSIPDYILNKAGRLSVGEFNIVKGHAYLTYHLLNMVDGFEAISKCAAFHHEKLSGAGYPFYQTRGDLALGSRIMAVSDVFSALAEERPHRKAFTPDVIIKELDSTVAWGELDGDIISLLKKNISDVMGLIHRDI